MVSKSPSSRPNVYRSQNLNASDSGRERIKAVLRRRKEPDETIVQRASQYADRSDGKPESPAPGTLAKGCSIPTFRRFCRGEPVRRFREFCTALELDPNEISGDPEPMLTVAIAPELAKQGGDRLPVKRNVCCIGRDRELDEIVEALRTHPRLYIRGARGSGKTTIADTIVRHEAIVRQFARRIRINVASHYNVGARLVPSWRAQCSIDAIERELARACSPRDSEIIPLDRGVLFTRLAASPTLLVIDDIDSADDLDALLGLIHDLPDSVRTIATGTAALDCDRIVKLRPLSAEASAQLIDTCCRDREVTVKTDDRQWLHEATYGFPAAIVKAVALFVESGRWQRQKIADFSEECWAGYTRLALQQLDADACAVAAAIGLFPQRIGLDALAEIAAIAPERLPAIAARLQDLTLIEYDAERQTCLAARLEREGLARALADRRDRGEFYQRWIARYCRIAADLTPDDWKVWEDYTPIEREWENWLAALEWCVERGEYDRVRDLWAGLRGYTNLHGYWKERLRWLKWAIDAAQQRGDRLAEARFWRDRAWTLALTEGTDYHARAEAEFERAILLAREARDAARLHGDADPDSERAWQEFQSELALERTVLCLESGKLDRAQAWIENERTYLTQLERSAKPESDDRLRLQLQRQRIRADYYEAEIFYNRKDFARARKAYSRVLRASRDLGWSQFCAYSTNWLADIALCDRSYEAAETWLHQTATYLEGQRDLRSWGFYYQSLAYAHRGRGLTEKARKAARKAANAFTQIGKTSHAQCLLDEFKAR